MTSANRNSQDSRRAKLLLVLAMTSGCAAQAAHRIAAEGRPALRFAGNTIQVFDAGGALRSETHVERTIDNVLDFTNDLVLYQLATPEGWPDGLLHVARFDGTAIEQPSIDTRIHSARIHADGRTVALITWAGELYFWDVYTNALDGPRLVSVMPFAVHFEPGGSYRVLAGVETGLEPVTADVWLLEVGTLRSTPLPTNGHALLPRWSAPGTIVYRSDALAWQMDVAIGREQSVAVSVHDAAQHSAVNVRPGLPTNAPEGAAVAPLVEGLSMRLPYPAGVSRDVWQAYEGDPGNVVGSHVRTDRYAIDFGPSWSEPSCGLGSPVLAIADGVVAVVAGTATNACTDPTTCTGCAHSGGLYVRIAHLGGYQSTYMHNSATHVREHDPVCQGLQISNLGNSGFACGTCPSDPSADGAHIHLRLVDATGTPIKPEPLSGNTGITTGATSPSDSWRNSLVSDNTLRTSCDGAPPAPPPTTTGSCPSGDGAYCGSSVMLDAGILYDCVGGRLSVREPCAWGCHISGARDADYCEPAPTSTPGACPSGDGAYCGESVGRTPGTLYDCAAGVYSVARVCPDGCTPAPPGSPDACTTSASGSCPSGDGLYCGDSVGRTAGTLYQCTAGTWSVSMVCPSGCTPAPPGTPDHCTSGSTGSCPSGDGLYCGDSVGRTAGTLYQCTAGTWSVSMVCPSGCTPAPPGTPDHCTSGSSGSCPSGDGLYCGDSVGRTAGTLYQCTAGTWSVSMVCPSGCTPAPPGTPDHCTSGSTGSCPSGDGLYCGDSVGRTAGTLYQCTAGSFRVSMVCPRGCMVAPPGMADYCL